MFGRGGNLTPFWLKQGVDDNDHHTHTQQARPRFTWSGKIFRNATQRCIDYIAIDSITARRQTTGDRLQRFPLPSDHMPVGLHIFLDDNYAYIDSCSRRSAPRPIGWALDHDKWGLWTEAVKTHVTNGRQQLPGHHKTSLKHRTSGM